MPSIRRSCRVLLAPAFFSLVLVALSGCSDEKGIGEVTWHQQIAPLVVPKCGGCHRPDGIAPFAVDTYEAAKPFADLMAGAVESNQMPPFLAQETEECTPPRPWAHDLRWSDDEKALLRAWVDQGAKEGDASRAVPPETPEVVALEREDVVLRLPEPITVDGRADMHTCAVVDPELDNDVYVTGRLITAGNTRVLHHVVSYVLTLVDAEGNPRPKAELEAAILAQRGVGIGGRYDCFGGPGLSSVEIEMLDAWAPGGYPNVAPPDSGQPVSKESLVLLDLHYHPTGGSPEIDADTTLSLMVAQTKPAMISQMILLGNFEGTFETPFGTARLLQQEGEDRAEFLIPAGAEDHVEEMTWTWELPLGLKVYAVGTHMHYVGFDMRVTLTHAEPSEGEAKRECLIQTPAWDFNWQRGYRYAGELDEMPEMRDGDRLNFRCRFDNSMGNPFVVDALRAQGLDAPVDVRLGEDTLDEMCLAAIGIAYPNP